MNEFEVIGKIYIWLGIDLFNKSAMNSTRKILQVLQNLTFPFFLHINVIFLQLLDIYEFQMRDLMKYYKILDFLMAIFPCALWWSIYNQRNAIWFVIQFILKVKENNKELKNSLKIVIISATVYWFVFTAFSGIIAGCVLERCFIYSDANITDCNSTFHINIKCELKKTTKDFFIHIQQLLMPFFFSILYFSISYNMAKILKLYQKRISEQNACYETEILFHILKEYIDLTKNAEKFAELFSLPLLWFSLQVICNIALIFVDILSFSDVTYLVVVNWFFVLVSLAGLISILSFCADEIPMRINDFKRALYDLKADRVFSKNNLETGDVIDIALNRESVSITIFRIMDFNRCFLLKSIATVVAHAVIYHQLVQV